MEWFGLTDNLLKSKMNIEDTIRSWFEVKSNPGRKSMKAVSESKRKEENSSQAPEDDEEEDYDVDELLAERALDDIYAEAESHLDNAPAQMGSHLKYIKGFGLKDLEFKLRKIDQSVANLLKEKQTPKIKQELERFQVEKRFVLQKKNLLQEIFSLYREERLILPNPVHLIENLINPNGRQNQSQIMNNLSMDFKWALYFEIVGRARKLCAEKVHKIEEDLKNEQGKLNQIRRFGEGHILKGSRVVGMTTTGAAKYNELVKMMESKIGKTI